MRDLLPPVSRSPQNLTSLRPATFDQRVNQSKICCWLAGRSALDYLSFRRTSCQELAICATRLASQTYPRRNCVQRVANLSCVCNPYAIAVYFDAGERHGF